MERCTRRSHGGVVLITGAGQAGLLWFGRKCSLIENLPTTRYPPLHPCSQLSGWYPHLRDEENEAREVPSIGQGLTVKEKAKNLGLPSQCLQSSRIHLTTCKRATTTTTGTHWRTLQHSVGAVLLYQGWVDCLWYLYSERGAGAFFLARVPGIPEVLPSGLLNLLLLHWVSKSM